MPPKTRGLADRLALREELARLEGAETPFEELARFLAPGPRGLEAIDDDDQALPVLHRRADEAVAGFVDVAGLQPVGADVHGRAADCGSAAGSCSR